MKINFQFVQEVKEDFHTIELFAGVRYWEDATINGEDALEDGSNVPCKVNDEWRPIIDIDSGVIKNWTQGVTAKVHFKVCDQCMVHIIGNTYRLVRDSYVPFFLAIDDEGYGDYIIMEIYHNGKIKNWSFDIDLEDYHVDLN